MKLSVSLSELLCKDAGAAAKALGVSRNKLVQTALKEFLERRRDEILTKSINRNIEKYGNDLSEEDEAWIAQGQKTVLQFLEDYESSTKRGRTAPRRKSKRR
jgi:metal-responsive CopG/Arc/MetJ family transcriptional regulator